MGELDTFSMEYGEKYGTPMNPMGENITGGKYLMTHNHNPTKRYRSDDYTHVNLTWRSCNKPQRTRGEREYQDSGHTHPTESSQGVHANYCYE